MVVLRLRGHSVVDTLEMNEVVIAIAVMLAYCYEIDSFTLVLKIHGHFLVRKLFSCYFFAIAVKRSLIVTPKTGDFCGTKRLKCCLC